MIWTVIAIILVVGLIALGAWSKSNLMSKGKIVQRDKDFAEYAEIFTLKPVTAEKIKEALENADFKRNGGVSISGDTSRITMKAASFFSATLVRTEKTEEKLVYRFDFTNWKGSHSSPEHETQMNIFLTAVEKMFLELDPETKVSTVKNDVKTKRSIF